MANKEDKTWYAGYMFPPAGSEEYRTSLTQLFSTIEANGLADRDHWDSAQGGKFRCPCCGRSLGAYYDHNLHRNAINRFNPKCTHFGKNGEYPSNAIGIEMACRGLEATAENAHFVYDSVFASRFSNGNQLRNFNDQAEKEQHAKASEVNRVTVKNLRILNDSRKDMQQDRALVSRILSMRGINTDNLPDHVFNSIGVARNIQLNRKNGTSGTVSWNGPVFFLGSPGEDGSYPSFQLRRMKGPSLNDFIGKDDRTSRFFTCGPARIFNERELGVSTTHPLFVCEGSIDALSVMALLHRPRHQHPSCAVAINGAANGSYFSELADGIDTKRCIYLALDPDAAGISGAESLKAMLKENGLTVLPFAGCLGCSDVNDMLVRLPQAGAVQMKIMDCIGIAVTEKLMPLNQACTILNELRDTGAGSHGRLINLLGKILFRGDQTEKHR